MGQSWLVTSAVGIVLGIVMGITLLALAALMLLRSSRRRRRALSPPETTSVSSLKSPDGSLYFRLDKLDEKGLTIGRGKAGIDLRIDASIPFADTVSSPHARIYYDSAYGHVIIEDLDSTNGVFINGRQAPRKNLLKDSWTVTLGSVTLNYHDGESDTGPLD